MPVKKCCKHIDITDEMFIYRCINECFQDKWRRREVQELLLKYDPNLTPGDVRFCVVMREHYPLRKAIDNMAASISHDIKNRCVVLPPTRSFKRTDSNSGKERDLTQETMIHQIFNYVAVNGMKELLDKKVSPNQVACIKNRGEKYGVQKTQRWIRTDYMGTKYCVKADIKKCYPSIPHDKLKARLERDIDNADLIYLVELLIDQFQEGIGIGSYLAAHLCNYYLSYLIREIFENPVYKVRRGKKIKAVRHAILQMDDLLLFGADRKMLRKAFHQAEKFLNEELGLAFKPSWRLFQVSDENFVDFLGYKIGRTRTTVRKRTFRRIIKALKKVAYRAKNHKSIHVHQARSLMSYYGRLKNCDCYNFVHKHWLTFNVARKTVSNFDRRKGQERECYR